LRAALLILLLAAARPAHALDAAPVASAEEDPEPSQDARRGRLQVRRDNVDRATREETTKTFVRLDNFVWGGMLSFQVAFPDEKTDFGGSPFDPRLGDSKVRFRVAPSSAGRFEISYFGEATFPTADPKELGSGKYQLSEGVSAATLLTPPAAMKSHELRFTSQLQQYNSVAGDDAAPDINYTKLDLSLRDTWSQHWLKAALNMRADWEQNGKTGAVAELEYGHRFDAHWSVWFLAGGRLWGEGVKGTYGSKVMIGVDRWF